ncbi:MAG: hypothetical protein A2Z38_03550 [Planctomycetes bacterium RBG_19FT_COMBO_48_8]|nr:MAG: hypothetical protein A2Z38_03550 [Planctomycetes bacterium RBG_19FT_COMBO_48_8]
MTGLAGLDIISGSESGKSSLYLDEETMNRSLLVIVLLVSAICLGGCIVIVDEETRGPGTHLPDDGTIAEIDAVGKLPFDSDRQQGYKRIAERQGLSPEVQVHLVEAVLGRLSFDNAKEDVLLTLIANPDFSRAAERTILDKLDKLAFANSKNKILKAISDRKNQG